MSSQQRISECLGRLEQSLQASGEVGFAEIVNRAMATEGNERDSFLVSNALWGGAGSMADQAGLSRDGGRTTGRVRIERADRPRGRTDSPLHGESANSHVGGGFQVTGTGMTSNKQLERTG